MLQTHLCLKITTVSNNFFFQVYLQKHQSEFAVYVSAKVAFVKTDKTGLENRKEVSTMSVG